MALFDPGQDGMEKMYITFANGQIFLATAQAPTESKNAAAVERLRQLVAETQAEVPGLNVGITGEPVLDHDEMKQSEKDTTVASIASLIICALIFIYGYQQTGRPIKATLCLIIGLGYTLAFTTLTVGHLNILTITFVPILIGLAIDYGVHLISRYEEELQRTKCGGCCYPRDDIYRPGNLYRRSYHRRGFFGHDFHRFQRHSGDGDHLWWRADHLFGANDDYAPGAAAARTSECIGSDSRGRQPTSTNRKSLVEASYYSSGCDRDLDCRFRDSIAKSLFRLQSAPHAERGAPCR